MTTIRGEVVVQPLFHDMKPRFEQFINDVRAIAAGVSGYSPDVAREYLVNMGASLWQELLPERLREQFWNYRPRIKKLVIFSGEDSVPWELLYPMDPGHDAGFLVEQFPVVRRTEDFSSTSTLNLGPTRFVLPPGSSKEMEEEVDALRQLLCSSQTDIAVISELRPLLDAIRHGDFGLLHFSCHNRYDSTRGLAMSLGQGTFTPTLMTAFITERTLRDCKPLVFINSNRSEGWARLFLRAGAGAAIGTLAAVTSKAAHLFSTELYRKLLAGVSLGQAAMEARQATANSRIDDPSWLVYTVYGDSDAKIAQPQPLWFGLDYH